MTTARVRILHVEDDPDIRLIVSLSLALDGGIELRSSGSGSGAITVLVEGDWHPDLLLLDMMMPDMDGTGLVTRVRAIDHLAQVPVIFLTARAQPADLELYRIAGALGLIVKPFDPLTLAGRVRALLAGPA